MSLSTVFKTWPDVISVVSWGLIIIIFYRPTWDGILLCLSLCTSHLVSLFIYLFTYLAASGLSCCTRALVPQPGIEPRPPALGTQNLIGPPGKSPFSLSKPKFPHL